MLSVEDFACLFALADNVDIAGLRVGHAHTLKIEVFFLGIVIGSDVLNAGGYVEQGSVEEEVGEGFVGEDRKSVV